MSHLIETAMYVADPAWHKLGNVLDHPPTIIEGLESSGLNWPGGVQLLPMFLDGGAMVPGRKAVVRMMDQKVLGTVGDGFRTVQNADAFNWFQPFLDSGLATLEAAGSLKGGARIWVLAKLKGDDSVIVPQSDDRVAKYLLLAHGHDGSLAVRLGLTPTRVVCQNTLSAAVGEGGTISIRHTRNVAQAMKAAQEIITRANAQFDKAAEVFRALARINVTEKQIREYVDVVFPPQKTAKPAPTDTTPAPEVITDGAADFASLLARPHISRGTSAEYDKAPVVTEVTDAARARFQDEFIRLFHQGKGNDMAGVKGTAWAAYNAVTDYISHERGNSDDNRLNGQWFGPESARAIQAASSMFLGASV